MISENIKHQIMELKASDKIDLVEIILESLNKSDLEIQNNWVKESEERYDAYKKGKVKSFSYEEVMSMLEK